MVFLVSLSPIFGWIGRYYVAKFTEELALEVKGTYEIEKKFGWFNSAIISRFEFDPRDLNGNVNNEIGENSVNEDPELNESAGRTNEFLQNGERNSGLIALKITHELKHGPLLFSTQPLEIVEPFIGPLIINSAALIEGPEGVELSKHIGDYVTAKTQFISLTEIATRIKPGKRQFSFEGALPTSVLSPELVLERSLFGNDTDAFFSIAKARIHSDDLSSPIFDDINLRLKPLTRKISPDFSSTAVVTAKKIRTERIALNNVRVISQLQPTSDSTVTFQYSFNIAELTSDLVTVAESIGGNIGVTGLTKSAVRPIIDNFDQVSVNNFSEVMVNQPFDGQGYLSANTSAGPINVKFQLVHKPGGGVRSNQTLMRLFQQISGSAEVDMSDDAFLLLQLGLKRILLDSESNSGITQIDGSSQISITINNGIAQIGNLYFDLPSLTLL